MHNETRENIKHLSFMARFYAEKICKDPAPYRAGFLEKEMAEIMLHADKVGLSARRKTSLLIFLEENMSRINEKTNKMKRKDAQNLYGVKPSESTKLLLG